MGMAASAPAAGPTIDAVVKWFKADKGYGFVELATARATPSCTPNALHASGHDSVPAGAKLKVLVGAGAKGAQVTRVMEVDNGRRGRASPALVQRQSRSRRAAAAPRRARPVDGGGARRHGQVVRRHQGFGFVASDDGGKDVFVHISILGPSGISRLTEGQHVNMRVVDTPKGREAISITV